MSETKNIHQRIHEAMGKVDYVRKSDKSAMQYKFVSHDAVTGVVRPALHEAGVVYFPQNLRVKQEGNRTEALFDVRFANVDNPTDCIDVPTFGYGIDNQDKGPGKAISYGVKYALLKTLGLETGDDPERDNIDHEEKPKNRANVRMVSEINQLTTPAQAKNWWYTNETDILALPEEYQLEVEGQFNQKLKAIESGEAVPGTWKWENVAAQDAWILKAKEVFDRCDTLTELAEKQAQVQVKINALEMKRKMSLIDYIQARRAQIESTNKNIEASNGV